MFGIGFSELLVIGVVTLLLFGPEQLPHAARTIGRLMAEFRKGSESLRREFYNSVYPPAEEFKRALHEESRPLRTLKAEIVSSVKKELGDITKEAEHSESGEEDPS